MHQTRMQYATWLGNTSSLLMISENDIFLRMGPAAIEDTRLTDTGVPGVIYNGVPDWLYQEEVLPKPQAIWPSVDGTHILYATFNDTRVTALEFPWFGTTGQDGISPNPLSASRSFPPSRSIRYPRPGSPNPEVELWVMELGNVSSMNFNTTGNVTWPTKMKLKPPPFLDGQYVKLLSVEEFLCPNCEISGIIFRKCRFNIKRY